MRAVIYTKSGDTSVLRVAERPLVEPAQGEVRIRVGVSGVNPTDWKSRSGAFGGATGEPTVPNHDGAGVVDAVGSGVAGIQAGDRVWVTLAADGRPASGTAQEYTVVPAERVFPLPESADFELGREHRHPWRDRPPRADGRGGRAIPPRAGCAAGSHRPDRGRSRRGRQRSHPASPLGRRDGHRHRQQ